MTKKYFAKYIIVDESFQEPGVYMNLEGNILNMTQELQDKAINEVGIQSFKRNFRPVRLVLCTREIVVGDTVQEWYGHKKYREYKVDCIYEETDSEGNLHLMIGGGSEAVNSLNCFKVIDVISLKANWVKEGDEFTEDEVNICYREVQIKCLNCNKFY